MTDYSEKIADYKKALVQDPKSMVFVPLTACYLKSGLLDDALETALKGTWESPDYPPGFVAVGHVYAHRQVAGKAIAAFQKAIDIDPTCLDAYKGMARVYREQGNIDAASNLLTNAIFLFPEESSLKQMLESLAPGTVESPPPAEPVAPSPQETASKPITTATIAEIYIEQGLYDKALEVYRELYEETQSPEVAKKIAEIEILAQGGAVQAAPVADTVSSPVTETVPVTPEAYAAEPPSGQSVLDILNGMLTSIQSRRSRV